jgi:F420-dependent oxidoreductase-like protein
MTGMRLAFAIGAVNAVNPAPGERIELAQAAERCGYQAIWVPEIHTTDPFAELGWIGSHTARIGLGCAVAQITARSAAAMAAGAVTLDSLSGGRFALGLGVSGPQVVEGWHGYSYQRPLSVMREYLAIVRMALAGEPIRYAGQYITLPAPSGTHHIAPLAFPTPPKHLPVYLAGLGPKSVALAGELADGWIAIHCPPEYMALARSWLEEGAARARRPLAGFTTSVMVLCCVDDDEDLARDLVRPVLAVYLGGMGSRVANFYNRLAVRLGFGRAAARVQDSYLAGDVDEAVEAVDDGLVDAMAVCGPAARVRQRLSDYRKVGVDTVIVGLAAPSHRSKLEQLELISVLADDPQRTPGDNLLREK